MKCQILFSRKNKKNIISFSSAEFAQSMVSVIIRNHQRNYYRICLVCDKTELPDKCSCIFTCMVSDQWKVKLFYEKMMNICN